MPIRFHNSGDNFILHGKTRVRQVLQEIAHDNGKSARAIDYIFCSKAEILRINRQFLGHDYYTDIITFPFRNEQEIEAELYVCVPVVLENAKDFGSTNYDELLRVIFHGMLHLVGYDDATDSERATMRAQEERYLTRFKEMK